MGFSMSWIAVKSDQRDTLFDLTGLVPTDEEDECFESPFSGAALKNGWFLIVGQGCDNRLIQQKNLSSISALGPTIACSIEEHVMYSSAQYWNSGNEVWAVSHDAQKGLFNLESSGEIPKSFESLSKKIIKEQKGKGGENAEVDLIFDIPLFLAMELTGFKHDEDCKVFEQPTPRVFKNKRVIKSVSKHSWWKYW